MKIPVPSVFVIDSQRKQAKLLTDILATAKSVRIPKLEAVRLARLDDVAEGVYVLANRLHLAMRIKEESPNSRVYATVPFEQIPEAYRQFFDGFGVTNFSGHPRVYLGKFLH